MAPRLLSMHMQPLAMLLLLVAAAESDAVFTCASTNDPLHCAALGDLYDATNGMGWLKNAGWRTAAAGTATDLCTFYGVSCGANGMPQSVNLGGNALRGTLPASLSALTTLQVLNLESNYLFGRLPDSLAWLPFNNFTGKVVWRSNGAVFEPFPTLGLYLAGNALSGPLPPSWAYWPARLKNMLYNMNLYVLTGFSGVTYSGPYLMLSLVRPQNSYAGASNWVNQICGTLPDDYTNRWYIPLTLHVDFMVPYVNGLSIPQLPPCPAQPAVTGAVAPPMSALFTLPPPTLSASGALSGVLQSMSLTDGSNNVYVSAIQASNVALSPSLSVPTLTVSDGASCAGTTPPKNTWNGLLFRLSPSGTPAWALQAAVACGSAAATVVALDESSGTLYWTINYALPTVACDSAACTSSATACTECPSQATCGTYDYDAHEFVAPACYPAAATLSLVTTYPGAAGRGATMNISLAGLTSGTLIVAVTNDGRATNWTYHDAEMDSLITAESNGLGGFSTDLGGLAFDASSGTLTLLRSLGSLTQLNASTATALWSTPDAALLAADAPSPAGFSYTFWHNGLLTVPDGSLVFCGSVGDQNLQGSGALLRPSGVYSVDTTSSFVARVNASSGTPLWAVPLCTAAGSIGYCNAGDIAPPTSSSVAIDAASNSMYVVGTMMAVRKCTAQGSCANTFIFGGNVSLSFSAAAVSPYGAPLPSPGTQFDTSLRQVFQYGYVAKLALPAGGKGTPAVSWVLPIASNDFLWAPGCDAEQGLPALTAWMGSFGYGCSGLAGAAVVGGTRVFAVTVDASDGSVVVTGHTVFNASFALPAGSTYGTVTFGTTAGAPSLVVPPTSTSFSFAPWPRTTGISWVVKLSASGTPLWVKTLGPPKPEGVQSPIVAVGRGGSLTFSGYASPTAASANASASAGGRHLLAAADDQTMLVAVYDTADATPAAVAFVQFNLTLAGFAADNFTEAAQGALKTTVATALSVAPSSVMVVGFTAPPAAARRRLQATTQANALVVSMAVSANNTAAAAALSGKVGTALTGSTFVTALNAALQSAGVTQQVTGVQAVLAPNANASSGAAAGRTAAARVLLAACASLLLSAAVL